MEIDFAKYPFPEKRPRHHISSAYYVPFNQLKIIPPYYPIPLKNIYWSEIFINAQKPQYLDVGCGKGKFLLEFALLHHNSNILGLEIKKLIVDWLKDVIKGEKIPNAGVLHYNVLNGLEFIETETIDSIFYLFPDPWPKAKHHKRRSINSFVISEFCRILKPQGKIYFATDIEEMHRYHLELLASNSIFKYEEVQMDEDWGLPKTNKQLSCEKRNLKYYRILAVKSD